MPARKSLSQMARRIAIFAVVPIVLAACAALLGCSSSQTCGTCTWELDTDGTLVIRPPMAMREN